MMKSQFRDRVLTISLMMEERVRNPYQGDGGVSYLDGRKERDAEDGEKKNLQRHTAVCDVRELDRWKGSRNI